MFKMISVKRIILLFVIFDTIYCTGEQLDSAVNKHATVNPNPNSSEIPVTKVKCPPEIKNCEETRGMCILDTKQVPKCKCIGEIEYDAAIGCKDTCDTITCQNGGECKIDDGNAVCHCSGSFTGDNCEIYKCDSITCQNGGECKIYRGNPVCVCTKEYKGDNCEILVKELCHEKNKSCDETGGTCTTKNRGNTIDCKCPTGKEYKGDNGCQSIDECQSMNTHNCPENTTCINTYDSYQCECGTGYRRKVKNLDPKKHGCEVCDPNPCENGGECVQNINRGFTCRCKPMYTGPICNETVTGKEDTKCVTLIGSVTGTALVLFLILIVILVVVLRKMKISKNHDDECSRRRQQRISGDVTQVQRKENEYVEINLHSNSIQHRPNNVEMRQVNTMPSVSIIPRAHLSRDNNVDDIFEDRCSTYDIPHKYSDIRSEEDKAVGSTMEYPNKAYGLEE